MTAKNDITGDSIKSKHITDAYADGWDRIFGKKKDAEKALEEMVRTNEELGLYDMQYDGCLIDPPSGHRYGFPKKFIVAEHNTFKDLLITSGYPLKDIDFALRHLRIIGEPNV